MNRVDITIKLDQLLATVASCVLTDIIQVLVLVVARKAAQTLCPEIVMARLVRATERWVKGPDLVLCSITVNYITTKVMHAR